MKKFLVLIIALAFLICSFAFTGVGAAAEEGVSPYEYAFFYANAHSRRDVRSGGEGAAAETLSTALSSKGYEVTTPSFRHYETAADGSKVVYEFKNVVGYKDNGKGECVLIGCYYGGFEPVDSYGVGTGGSAALSVGALLYVADQLSAASASYDIAIAFWGGMEVADGFDVKQCGVDLKKIALYINLDCVAAGTNDYLYADDLPRSQGKFFANVVKDLGADIKAPPTYKKPASLYYGENDAFTYMHLGNAGVNRFFMGEDVPCVNFVGGAWDYDCGLYRYTGKGTIEGTSLDKIEEIDKLNGGAENTQTRLISVANVIVKGVTDETLPAVIDRAKKEVSSKSLNSDLAFYLIVFIGTVVLAALLIILLTKQGKDRREAVWDASFEQRQENPYEEFRNNPPQGDVFEPKEQEPKKDDDDNDDVFRF